MAQSRVTIQLGEVTNSCFVVMPFAVLFDREYSQVIKPAIEAFGLDCVRGNEIYSEQSIVHDIWKSIRAARIVVAELSGRNPNVLYEVGLAHALGKPIILLTRNQDDVPFDLKSLRYVYYDTDNPDWGSDLRSELRRAIGRVLESPSLAGHLHDIKVETKLPAVPDQPLAKAEDSFVPTSIAGAWRASWISVLKEREHMASMVIPADHGTEFTASLTVAYWKGTQQTVVEETLKGNLDQTHLSLAGVNYTYVQRGASAGYALDKFDLTLSENGEKLQGTVTLRHGVRKIEFLRINKDDQSETGA